MQTKLNYFGQNIGAQKTGGQYTTILMILTLYVLLIHQCSMHGATLICYIKVSLYIIIISSIDLYWCSTSPAGQDEIVEKSASHEDTSL